MATDFTPKLALLKPSQWKFIKKQAKEKNIYVNEYIRQLVDSQMKRCTPKKRVT